MIGIEYTQDGIIVDGERVSLAEITEGVNAKKVNANHYVILKIEWPFNRGFDGALEEILLSEDDAKEVKNILVGSSCDFGDIAGKHSCISGMLEADEITVVDDVDAVLDFMRVNPEGHAYNHSFIDTVYNSFFEDHISVGENEINTLKRVLGYE